MRLLICAGGTGGGVYPALAVLETLASDDMASLWVGGRGGVEAELVKRAGVEFIGIPAAGVHGVGMRALPGNILRLARGYREARGILDRFRPQVIFFTGGYVAAPVALAGRRIPSVIFVPDLEPGLALKFVSRFADRIAVTAEESRRFFPAASNLSVTGYPCRESLKAWTPEKGRQALSLSREWPTLLVVGGSTGARAINKAVVTALPALLAEMQVVHLTGRLDWEFIHTETSRLPEDQSARYHAFPYLHEKMGAALAAADLALSRAGASTLGEFPLFGLPAILVPYPHAWRYQRVNAGFLADRGAAVLLDEADLPTRLIPEVVGLMQDRELREKLRAAMKSLARPRAAHQIAGLLTSLAFGADHLDEQGNARW